MFTMPGCAGTIRSLVNTALCCAGMLLASLSTAASAQELNIKATVGPAIQQQTGASSPLVFTWDQLMLLAQVKESGHPLVGFDREATGVIPSPFRAASSSGESWIDFSVDGPGSVAILRAHLDQVENSDIPGMSYLAGELRGWIADIIVPPHTTARLALEFEVTSDIPRGLSFQLSGFLGTPTGSEFWQTSTELSTSRTLFSNFTFDNSTGTVPLHTGPVYFTASMQFQTVPIPEPGSGRMLATGLLVFVGLFYRRNARRKLIPHRASSAPVD